STGAPKGVLVTHSNVARLLHATEDWFHFDERDTWTLFHSFSFDVSVFELWGALSYGGRVVLVPYLLSRSPDLFFETLVREGVTVLSQPPSAFYQLIHAEEESPRRAALSLRSIIFAGEALDLERLKPWFERHDDTRPLPVNMYGITETTVHVTYRPIRNSDLNGASASL